MSTSLTNLLCHEAIISWEGNILKGVKIVLKKCMREREKDVDEVGGERGRFVRQRPQEKSTEMEIERQRVQLR